MSTGIDIYSGMTGLLTTIGTGIAGIGIVGTMVSTMGGTGHGITSTMVDMIGDGI